MSGPERSRTSYSLRLVPSTAPDRLRRREQAAKLLLGLSAEKPQEEEVVPANTPPPAPRAA